MTPTIFCGAYILDLIIGDPRWAPHPVVLIGRLGRFLEEKIRRGFLPVDERKGGIVLWFSVVIAVYCVTWGIVTVCFSIQHVIGMAVAMILGSLTLATRSLYGESRIVIDALESGDIVEARRRLSMIVGRDTENLDERGILRAVIETVSENLSDGIVAPLFYLAIGGVPLAMAYKAVNTLDSMVGYQNQLYGDIGFFSAKMDDGANWIPARITGALIVVVSFMARLNAGESWTMMIRDGGNHASPNSGIPEAAMAGALGVQLGGRIQYSGEVYDKPTIGDRRKAIEKRDVARAWGVMFGSSFLMAGLCLTVMWIVQS